MDTVYVEHWQHECCGAAFAVGDDVLWPLRDDHDRGRLGRWLGPAVAATVDASVDRHTEDAAMTRLRVIAIEAVFCEYEPTPDDPEGSSHGPVAGSWTGRRLDAVAGRSERLPGLEWVGYVVQVQGDAAGHVPEVPPVVSARPAPAP